MRLPKIKQLSPAPIVAGIFSFVVIAAGLANRDFVTAQEGADSPKFAVPAGLKKIKHPADNPLTVAKVKLGKQLYFDPRLSSDNTISCKSCHDRMDRHGQHKSHAKAACASCHPAHTWTSTRRLCLKCHPKQISHGVANSCWSCHSFRGKGMQMPL